jgi:hypothetical protein
VRGRSDQDDRHAGLDIYDFFIKADYSAAIPELASMMPDSVRPR